MNTTLFISLFTFGAAASSVVTEAIKKYFDNEHKEYSSNIIALVDAAIVGGLGTAASYVLLDIPWTVNNIICLLLMIVVIWLGSMLGYDKVVQLLKQLKSKGVENES